MSGSREAGGRKHRGGERRWVVGVDSGGSGLRVALARPEDGERAGEAIGTEPVRTGPRGIDAGHLLALLLPAVRELLARAGEAGPRRGGAVAAVAVGAAGMATLGGDLRARLPGALAAELGVRRLALAADAVTAYAGALGQRAGAVVAAGTGVIALGADPDASHGAGDHLPLGHRLSGASPHPGAPRGHGDPPGSGPVRAARGPAGPAGPGGRPASRPSAPPGALPGAGTPPEGAPVSGGSPDRPAPGGGWRRADGWGHLLGDCGGGAWIGRAGLEAALRAHDGRRGGSEALLARLEAVFGPAAGLPAQLYPRSDRAAVLASFAPEVAACAGEDPVAAGILRDAARGIAETTAAVCPPATGCPVAFTGGLLGMGPLLLEPFREELSRLAPHARPVSAEGGPLDGALRIAGELARGSLRLPVDGSLLALCPHPPAPS
ncbi:ATPase [Streptomyces sp. F63]|uniref:BadF/BadG/BcrA/BcrD ATPase family protein n=1 Tax=Streptomyces sp. F63 TaxID=2824887 RepID=UPI001B379C67|nr:BadF/BadG/BcrA/BcrD ATPase family protein [Streptomyces sp. F63]MBQ0985707.1 ATPase [Streptomyces sp. F63]